jgi:Tol biopolymer transport system component
MIAFAARGHLELLNLATCRVRVLADVSATDVRFSPDGRWLAYSPLVDDGTTPAGMFVVSVHGGPVRTPLGAGVQAWSWAPTGDRLYGVTSDGSLVSSSPTGQRRTVTTGLGRVTPTMFGLSFGLSPDGARAVVDSFCSPQPVGELDLIDLRTGARRVIIRPGEPVVVAGFSPDGRWLLFWPDEQCSGSIAADGMPLEALPVTGGKPVMAVKHMLLYPDFLSWCGRRLIAAAGPSRETQLDSKLVATGPPTWRQRTIELASKLSWVSPACAPSGKLLAAAAGANLEDAGFGIEHRSIWLLRPSGAIVRRLTQPPARDLSDEAPRFSRDGRWVMFVRSRLVFFRTRAGWSGVSKSMIELAPTNGSGGAVSVIRFTGNDVSYYDHFDWPDEIDWYQPH